VIFIASLVITIVFLVSIIEGTAFTVDGLMQDFGISAE
jgi:hypothetical protein